jgi:hypothetical protein
VDQEGFMVQGASEFRRSKMLIHGFVRDIVHLPMSRVKSEFVQRARFHDRRYNSEFDIVGWRYCLEGVARAAGDGFLDVT